MSRETLVPVRPAGVGSLTWRSASEAEALAVAAALMPELDRMICSEGRYAVGYQVQPYSWSAASGSRPAPASFGIVRRWRYFDRPDLPEMGGAFLDNDAVAGLLSRSLARGVRR